MRRLWPALGRSVTAKNNINMQGTNVKKIPFLYFRNFFFKLTESLTGGCGCRCIEDRHKTQRKQFCKYDSKFKTQYSNIIQLTVSDRIVTDSECIADKCFCKSHYIRLYLILFPFCYVSLFIGDSYFWNWCQPNCKWPLTFNLVGVNGTPSFIIRGCTPPTTHSNQFQLFHDSGR